MTFPTPLVNVTFAVAPRVPLWPLVALKKPLAELVLSVSVVVPVLVVLLPNWSLSWSPSAMLVLAETPTEPGVGVMTTWVGVAPMIVSVWVPVWRPLAPAESVGEPAVVSA